MSTDGHFAYVVASNEYIAQIKMASATTLDVEIVDKRNASEFPYILDKMNYKSGIYLSYILPF